MGLKEFGKKLDDVLNTLDKEINNFANDASNQINSVITSLDEGMNGGGQRIGEKFDAAIGVPQNPPIQGETPVFNNENVAGLHGQNETSVQDVIKEPINVVVNPEVFPNAAPQAYAIPQPEVVPQTEVVPQPEVAPQTEVVPQPEVAPQEDSKPNVVIPSAILDKVVEEDSVGAEVEEIPVENVVEVSENNEQE